MMELYQPQLDEWRALLRRPQSFRRWTIIPGALSPLPVLDQSRQLIQSEPLSVRYALPFLIVLPEAQVVVGNIGGKGLLPGEEEIELGYSIAQAYRRRGLATEAIRRIVILARADGLTPIAHVEPENEASRRALRKNGFRVVATFHFPASLKLERWRWSAD